MDARHAWGGALWRCGVVAVRGTERVAYLVGCQGLVGVLFMSARSPSFCEYRSLWCHFCVVAAINLTFPCSNRKLLFAGGRSSKQSHPTLSSTHGNGSSLPSRPVCVHSFDKGMLSLSSSSSLTDTRHQLKSPLIIR